MFTFPISTYGSVNNPGTLKTNLISCWEMNESSGNIIDQHGSTDLSVISSPTYGATGHIGDSILLNGTTQYLKGPATNLFNPSSAASYSSWVNRIDNSADASHTLHSRYYSSTGLRIFYITFVNGSHATLANRLAFAYYDTSNVVNLVDYNVNGSDIWSNEWNFIVATRSGSTGKLYVNGELVNSNTAGNGSCQQTSAVNNFYNIGAMSRSSTTPDSFLKGRIDQSAAWSKELTGEEIKFLYNQGSGVPYSVW